MKQRCLGLDISRYSTGWCIVDVNTEKQLKTYCEGMKIVQYGYLDTSSIKEEGSMLIYLEQEFTNIIEQHKPTIIVAEQQFVGKNAQTGLVLAGIHAIYYPILTMKSTTLNGIKLKKDDGTRKTRLEIKQEVQQEVFNIFNNTKFINITDDVTDAISAVITYVRLDGQIIGKQSANYKNKPAKKHTISNKRERKTKKDG